MGTFADDDFGIYHQGASDQLIFFDLARVAAASYSKIAVVTDGSAALTLPLLQIDNDDWTGGNVFRGDSDNFKIKNGTGGGAFALIIDTSAITSTDKRLTLQDASGTLPLLEVAQTWTLGQAFTSGIAIGDAGASSNVVSIIADTLTADRSHTLPNQGPAKLVLVGTGAAGALGFSDTLAMDDRAAQSAAIGATQLTQSAAAGMYRVTYTLADTSTQVGVATVQFQISYTDDAGATTQTGAALSLTAAGRDRGSFTAYLASGDITYQTNVTGVIGAGRYSLHVRCESLG